MIINTQIGGLYMKHEFEGTGIGGGTGQSTILTGLKPFLNQLKMNAITTVADSGGSSGRLFDQYGSLPSGDSSKCMVAMSKQSENIRNGLTFRFNQDEKSVATTKAVLEILQETEKGRALIPAFKELAKGLSGHTLMNLIMTVYEEIAGRKESIEILSKWWDVQGNVIPATYDDVTLIAKTNSGKEYIGEHLIDEVLIDDFITQVRYESKPSVNPDAIKAIIDSDIVILTPGDIYTSLMPVLIIEEIAMAINNSKAKKLLITPLMNKFGHTNGFSVERYVQVYSSILGERAIDYVLYNTQVPSKELLSAYEDEAEIVRRDGSDVPDHIQLIGKDLIAPTLANQQQSDIVNRSLIRHEPHITASMIFSLLRKGR